MSETRPFGRFQRATKAKSARRLPCAYAVTLLVSLACFGAAVAAEAIRADGPEDSGTGVNAPLANLKAARKNISDAASRESICLMVESAARANGLPLEFFARV